MGTTIVSTFIHKKYRGLFKEGLARVELEDGNHLLPKIYLQKSIREELSAPWEDGDKATKKEMCAF